MRPGSLAAASGRREALPVAIAAIDGAAAILLPVRTFGMQRRIVLFLVAVLALAAAVFVLSRGGEVDVPPPGPGPGGTDANGEAPPVSPQPQPQPAPQPAPTPAPPGAPRVVVEVTMRERYVAPSPSRVTAVRAGDEVPLPAAVVAGAGAGFDASPNAAGTALAVVDGADGRLLRQVALTAGASATVRVGARLVVRGTVVDAKQQPLREATVWFGEFDASGARREHPLDDEGLFTAEVASGDGVPFVARAPGYASQWRTIEVRAAGLRCDAVLERACALDVQIVARAEAMASARVFVVPRGVVSTSLAQWPFFVQALTDGVPVGERGDATIPDLPPGGEAGVLVVHPLAAVGAPVAVVLKGERVRALVPLEFTAAKWRGSVVDDAAQPLAGVSLFARARSGPLVPGTSQRLLPPHLEQRGDFRSWSGNDGTFVLGASTGADGVLSLRAAGHAGRDVAAAAAVAAPLVLPAWRGGEVELLLAPPRAGTPWVVEANLAGGVRELLAADARFRVSLPHAGRFDFVLTTFVGDEQRAQERHDGVHATGAIELSAPRTP
jgi:hypothetical protein